MAAIGTDLEDGKKIEWLYTERQPCGIAPGHANCTKYLIDWLEEHGTRGIMTPVFYSFEYPTKADYAHLIKRGSSESDVRKLAQEKCAICTTNLIAKDKTLLPLDFPPYLSESSGSQSGYSMSDDKYGD